MLFWSELVEGGAALRQQVFLNAGIIARRKDGSKQGSIPIHTHAPNYFSPQVDLSISVSRKITALLGNSGICVSGFIRYSHFRPSLPAR